jgi:hypothetical protein
LGGNRESEFWERLNQKARELEAKEAARRRSSEQLK